ncbi:MAG: tRNA 2-selenouridine(34) synthase MnmH [Gammaproteobacteria bacterium]|nr:tRNA 2-selenouridine(34) synthase MnmH [Gammaproteobacteria bacterium]
MDLPQIDDYRTLFLNNTALLDVRAPIEFNQGAFPFSENYPLINDNERDIIGKKYKDMGQDEAIELGHQLVQGDTKLARINKWQSYIKQHPEGVLYCFRGGMRSKISQQWIYEHTGIVYPRVKGGYKAMRRYLLDELETSVNDIQPVVLGGRTGIGKTILLDKLKQKTDLENLFHHRGSVFGKHVTPQPTQITIENTLSINLLNHRNQNTSHIVFEDEAPNIGSRRIPEILFNKMQQSPIIQLETSVDSRIDITFQEYIIEALDEHQSFYGIDSGFNKWSSQLNEAIDKIQRRLGGVRYKELKSILNEALTEHQSTGNMQLHREWIKSLLVDYYDPMYDYQFSKKADRVIFKGSHDEVLDYLLSKYQLS